MKRLFQLLIKKISQLVDWIIHVPYNKLFRDTFTFIGDIMHRLLFKVLLPKRWRSLTKQEIYTIIFKSDTPRGKKFDIILLVLIAINIVVIMMESVAGMPQWFGIVMQILGWLFTILFTFEFYLRIYCISKPKLYLTSFYGIIDMLSIFPAYLGLFFPGMATLQVLRMMRMMRIFRILQMQKFLDEMRFLIDALKRSAIKIFVFMIFVFIVAVILGATMYGIEGGKNPAISSIPRGVYWAVVTITTVGYGDITPITAAGQFISLVVMLLGYSIIAIPTGIVAGETIEEHKRSKHHKRKNRLNELRHDSDQSPEEPTPDLVSREIDPAVDAKREDLL